jgi:hypothetical protein
LEVLVGRSGFVPVFNTDRNLTGSAGTANRNNRSKPEPLTCTHLRGDVTRRRLRAYVIKNITGGGAFQPFRTYLVFLSKMTGTRNRNNWNEHRNAQLR